MISYNTAIVLSGSALLGASAGMIGSFAVLRRRALTGDALAHAALPGLCLAFLFLGYKSLPAMLIGALGTGILGVTVISFLRRWTRIKEDAAIGIVLGTFFGAGIVLMRLIQNNSATGNKAGLPSYILGKTAGMILNDVYLIAGMGIGCMLLVLLLYKEFKLTVFDPGFAKAQGWPVLRLDLLLMSLVAVAVVIGLPAVGAVLMAALLILPAAAARFWTDRFGKLLLLSSIFGTITGLTGTALSAQFELLPAGPIIILTGGALFMFSVLIAPRRGLVARAAQQWHFRRELAAGRIVPDDMQFDLELSPVSVGAIAEVDVASLTSSATDRPAPVQKTPAASAKPVSVAANKQRSASLEEPAHSLWAPVATLILAAVAASLFAWWWNSLSTEDRKLSAWTIVIGSLTNIPCAILGCYLVLRRMSLLGDAISHSVLPGIALAFLFSGQVTGPPIIIGAMVVGVLTALLTHTLHALGRVPEDSSLGIVFSSMFAAGVIMISRYAAHTDLDPDCVLYGLLEFAALDTVQVGSWEIPRTLPILLITCAYTILFVTALWKELKISSFDPGLATAMGIKSGVMHYLLMGFVAAVVVSAFEAVGSVLVVAMLIVPPATAHFLTDRLAPMIGWSVIVAILSAIIGDAAARYLNTNVAGMMAVAAGIQFTLAVFFAPRHGLVSKWLRNFQLSLRIASEDVIALLYRAEEAAQTSGLSAAAVSFSKARTVTHGLAGLFAVPQLRRRSQIRADHGKLSLTESGRQLARSIVRSHRLWETYLGEQTDLPLDHLHAPAERMEHFIGRELQEQIAAELPATQVDPHGRVIPPEPPQTN